jgi:hypothetical protein
MASSRAASPEQIQAWRPGSSLRATSVRDKLDPESAGKVGTFLSGGRRSHTWKRAMHAMLDVRVPEAEVLAMVAIVTTKEIRAQELAIGGATSDCGTLLHGGSLCFSRGACSSRNIHVWPTRNTQFFCNFCVCFGVTLYGCVCAVFVCPTAAAIAGRVKAAIELLRCGADLHARNQFSETAMDLALRHKQEAVQVFLGPGNAQASVDAQPSYAKAERDLVWAQRKRRAAVRKHDRGRGWWSRVDVRFTTAVNESAHSGLLAHPRACLFFVQVQRRAAAAKMSADEAEGAASALASHELEEWTHLEGTFAAQGLCLDTIQAMKARRSMW